jgi:BirA family biotin operon repressor/biotin-[acetyl-CoA-carboxylase] ligase
LDEARIRHRLRRNRFVTRLIVLESTDSTNDEMCRLAASGAPAGTAVVADRQTAGRGRRGRFWHSSPGLGLYVSVLLRPRQEVRQLTRWTLAAGVAACEACREGVDRPVQIEWPNDLVWENRKLGGLLIETRSQGPAGAEVVVGLGINVSHQPSDFPQAIRDRATSLVLAAGGSAPSREQLAAAYLSWLARVAVELEAEGWDAIAERWEKLAHGPRGRRVLVEQSGGPASYAEAGVTDGLAPDGALRVRLDRGGMIAVRMSDAVTPLEV